MFERETRRTRLLETRSRQKHETTVRKFPEIANEELLDELRRTTETYLTKIEEEKSLLERFAEEIDQ